MKKLLCVVAVMLAFAACASAAEAPLKSIEELASQSLAAQRGTTGAMIAEEMLGDAAKTMLTTYERYADAIAALRSKKVRAVIMDEAPAARFVEGADDIVIMDEPLAVESYAIGFKKGSELVAQVNEHLTAIKESGELAAIIDKYMSGADVKPEDIDLNKGASGGELVMGTEAGFAPYELRVGSGYIGIDVEVMALVAKRMGRELVVENMNFDALPMAVSTGKVDLIAAGITVTEERKKNMDFSVNYIEGAKQVAVVRADDIAR